MQPTHNRSILGSNPSAPTQWSHIRKLPKRKKKEMATELPPNFQVTEEVDLGDGGKIYYSEDKGISIYVGPPYKKMPLKKKYR